MLFGVLVNGAFKSTFLPVVSLNMGELVYVMEAPKGWILSSLFHIANYLMMSFAPHTNLRSDDGCWEDDIMLS